MIYKIKDNQVVKIDQSVASVEKFYVNYVPDGSLIVFDGINLEHVDIPDFITHIVFDDATNPVLVEKHLSEIKISRPFTLVTGLFHYHQTPPSYQNVKFFPFWAIWMSTRDYEFSSIPKKYQISCLNGIPREHRKLVYLKLQSKPYFKDIVFTFGHRPGIHYNFDTWSLTNQEQEQFSLLPQQIGFLPSDCGDIDLSINHPAYQESYVNLVTETTIRLDTPMLSEKTFKPIIAGQLFVLIASPGAIQFLRRIGIDVFDDIINHSYDSIFDTRIRIEQALNQIDRLYQMDLAGLYDKIKARLERNSEYFKSQTFRDQFDQNFG